MSMLLDSSEIREAALLIEQLLKKAPALSLVAQEGSPKPATPAAPPTIAMPDLATLPFRADRLQHILTTLCQRGGFSGAVFADSKGFPLAVHNSPVDGDAIAAFTSVLGDALEKAGKLLGHYDLETIAMDINYTEKMVLRRFSIEELPYYMLVICPQSTDERDEVEISIEQATSTLTSN